MYDSLLHRPLYQIADIRCSVAFGHTSEGDIIELWRVLFRMGGCR